MKCLPALPSASTDVADRPRVIPIKRPTKGQNDHLRRKEAKKRRKRVGVTIDMVVRKNPKNRQKIVTPIGPILMRTVTLGQRVQRRVILIGNQIAQLQMPMKVMLKYGSLKKAKFTWF
jgi:hypothetical protein